MNSGQSSGAAAHVILHIGAGSFHRAHQAWYLHRLNEAKVAGEPHWSLTVGNIRSDMNAVLDALAAQNGVYTLETVTPQGERAYETIRSIERVVPWTDSLDGADRSRRRSGLQDHRVHGHRRRLLPRRTGRTRYRECRPRRRSERRPHDDLRRAGRDSRCTHETRRRPRHAANLRQPAQQRRAFSCRHERVSGAARRGRTGAMVRRQHGVSEFDGRPHYAAPHARRERAREGRDRCRRRVSGDGRGVHPVGDRRPLHRRTPRMGEGRRGTGRLGDALRGSENPHSERDAQLHCVGGHAGRAELHPRRHARHRHPEIRLTTT